MAPASVVLRKCNKVKSGINAVTNPAMVVDLPAPLPPESVVTNSSKSKVRAKKPFQLMSVKERNLPRSTPLFWLKITGATSEDTVSITSFSRDNSSVIILVPLL